MSSNLTNIAGKWMKGCSCNKATQQEIVPPPNSKAVQVLLYGDQIGPVTETKYHILPTQVSIDIDAADADAWLNAGQARLPLPGIKGRLARINET